VTQQRRHAGQFATLEAHFGESIGSGSGASGNAAIPEPTTLVMLLVAAVGIRLRRRNVDIEWQKLNSA